jgi:Flp pilus assembly protein TadG
MVAMRNERGQSLVEFALIIPIVLILMLGLFDLGRIVFTNNSLSDGARQGARNGSTDPRAADYCSVVDEAVRSAIRDQPLDTYIVTYTTVDPSGVESGTYILCQNGINGPGKAALPITAGPGDRVRVDLDADLDLALGIIAQAAGQSTFSLHAESTMQVTFAPVN